MNPPGLTIGMNYLERGKCVLGTLQAQGKALEHPEGVKAEGEKGMAAGDRALNSSLPTSTPSRWKGHGSGERILE